MKKFFIALSIILGCAEMSFAQKYVDYQSAQSRVLDVVTSGFVVPKIVELEMVAISTSNKEGRIVDSVYYSNAQIDAMKGEETNIRANASFRLCEKYNADVIVGALYDIHNTTNHAGYIVKVIGYPARFHNWRNIQEQDYKWIGLQNMTTDVDKTKAVIKK